MASPDRRRIEKRDGTRSPSPVPVAASLAPRLDHLLRTVHPPDWAEYTYREVAAAIEATSGAKISAAYINYLRLGRRDNPTLRQLKALADFFGVPVSYFTDADADGSYGGPLAVLTGNWRRELPACSAKRALTNRRCEPSGCSSTTPESTVPRRLRATRQPRR